MTTLAAIGVLSSLGYPLGSSCQAPTKVMATPIRQHLLTRRSNPQYRQQLISAEGLTLNWQTLKPSLCVTGDKRLSQLTVQLSQRTQALVCEDQRFLVIGGDHSLAMGSWSGVIQAMEQRKNLSSNSKTDLSHHKSDFGLIWIDAHLDAHSFTSSPSGNIHGMPLHALLGDTDPRLNQFCPAAGKLQGENLQLIGIRDYEQPELNFLTDHRAKIHFMSDTPSGDCTDTLMAAMQDLCSRCDTVGISIDMDAIDPSQAPGVATPVNKGLNLDSLCEALKQIARNKQFVGLEICEFDPSKDQHQITLNAVAKLICAAFVAPESRETLFH
ncbi:MAG: arginase family protein [Immundisolibacteraceae bacterium]|nr:arginase family protein [Immundisolibacteraceae bacterium]